VGSGSLPNQPAALYDGANIEASMAIRTGDLVKKPAKTSP